MRPVLRQHVGLNNKQMVPRWAVSFLAFADALKSDYAINNPTAALHVTRTDIWHLVRNAADDEHVMVITLLI